MAKPIVEAVLRLMISSNSVASCTGKPSGAKTRVGYWGSVNPDCSSKGDTVIRVTNPPEHGAVEVGKSTDYLGYPKENIRAKCNQHKVAVTQIMYKSADKYVGKDTIDFLVLFPDSGMAWEVHYEIDVK